MVPLVEDWQHRPALPSGQTDGTCRIEELFKTGLASGNWKEKQTQTSRNRNDRMRKTDTEIDVGQREKQTDIYIYVIYKYIDIRRREK